MHYNAYLKGRFDDKITFSGKKRSSNNSNS